MSNASITDENIYHLLTGLSFNCEVRPTERNAVADSLKQQVVYRHEKKGTLVKFPSDEPVPCLEGELLSLRAHFVGRDHIEEDAVDAFIETGRLPVLR